MQEFVPDLDEIIENLNKVADKLTELVESGNYDDGDLHVAATFLKLNAKYLQKYKKLKERTNYWK